MKRRRRRRRRDDDLQNCPKKIRNEAATWKLPVLDVEVREDDGDVGYLPVPSAWTEELHGELSTATCFGELRGTEGKRRRRRGVAARGRRGEVGLGFAAPWGSCRGREQVGRGPAAVVVRRACLCLSAGPTVTRTTVGATCQREKERGERAGLAG